MEAIKASAVHTAHPRNANTGARDHPFSRKHFSYDLVPRSDARITRRKLTFRNVQVSAANATGAHFQQNMPRLRLRRGYVLNFEGRS